MKRIKIKPHDDFSPVACGPRRGMLQVTIDWNKSYYFNSKRNVLRFLAIANQFFTQAMYKARNIYIDILIQYNKDWGYFETETSAFHLADKNRRCEQAIASCAEAFNLMVERSEFTSGAFIVTGKLSVIIDRMRQAISILKEINSSKSNASVLYQMDDLSDRVYYLEHSIKVFGDYEAEHLTKRPIHESTVQPSILMDNAKISIAS